MLILSFFNIDLATHKVCLRVPRFIAAVERNLRFYECFVSLRRREPPAASFLWKGSPIHTLACAYGAVVHDLMGAPLSVF